MHIAKHCTLHYNAAEIIERQTLQYHSSSAGTNGGQIIIQGWI